MVPVCSALLKWMNVAPHGQHIYLHNLLSAYVGLSNYKDTFIYSVLGDFFAKTATEMYI